MTPIAPETDAVSREGGGVGRGTVGVRETTWAQASFTATHQLYEKAVHGHTWQVRAHRASRPMRDARELQRSLTATLSLIEGKHLNDTLDSHGATMEGLCGWVLKRLRPAGVIGVEVWRPDLGLGASKWS